MNIAKGKIYRNIKHQTLYHVLGIFIHSETRELMVAYERVEPEERFAYPFVRPLDLFREKFESLEGDV